jgi:transposase
MNTLRLAHRKEQQKVWARQRLRAGRLFARGWRQADVARRVGVDARRVNDWHKRWLAGGMPALRSKGPVGGRPRLDQRQWRELERVLKAGPAAAGFDSGGWTLARIAAVVADRFAGGLPPLRAVVPAAPARVERAASGGGRAGA